MNRVIKFRGKAIKPSLGWIYGDLIQLSEVLPVIQRYEGQMLVDGEECKRFSQDKVHPETVGQFTGLNDKEGLPIYEGDIIKGPHDYRHVIQYFAPEARFTANLIGFECFDHCGINQKWIDDCAKVVIGNIHDNPELMKGDKICIQ